MGELKAIQYCSSLHDIDCTIALFIDRCSSDLQGCRHLHCPERKGAVLAAAFSAWDCAIVREIDHHLLKMLKQLKCELVISQIPYLLSD